MSAPHDDPRQPAPSITRLKRCREYGALHGTVDGCHCDAVTGFDEVEVVSLDALRALLTSDVAVEAMILAASNPVHDDGHTDTYYRGLIEAAVNAALGSRPDPTQEKP